jgi:hypothetical protein
MKHVIEQQLQLFLNFLPPTWCRWYFFPPTMGSQILCTHIKKRKIEGRNKKNLKMKMNFLKMNFFCILFFITQLKFLSKPFL